MSDVYQPPATQLTDASTPAHYAGFWVRLAASLVDGIAMMLVTVSLSFAAFGWDEYLSNQHALTTGDILINYLLPAVLVLGFWRTKLATPGKLLVGIRIVDATTLGRPTMGQLLGRYFGYLVSFALAGLGFAWVAWDRRKQGLHDKLAGTVVVMALAPLPAPRPERPHTARRGRARQTLVPIALGAVVIGLAAVGIRAAEGLGAPDLEAPGSFDHGGISLRYPGNWAATDRHHHGALRMLQLSTPGDSTVLLLVTDRPGHVLGYGETVLDALEEEFGRGAEIGGFPILEFERAAPTAVKATISGVPVEGQEWAFTLRVFGIPDPGHAGYFPVVGTPDSLGIVYHGSKQDAQHLKAGLDFIYDSVAVKGARQAGGAGPTG